MSDPKKTNKEYLSEVFEDIAELVMKLLDDAYDKGYADGMKAKEDKEHDG